MILDLVFTGLSVAVAVFMLTFLNAVTKELRPPRTPGIERRSNSVAPGCASPHHPQQSAPLRVLFPAIQ